MPGHSASHALACLVAAQLEMELRCVGADRAAHVGATRQREVAERRDADDEG